MLEDVGVCVDEIASICELVAEVSLQNMVSIPRTWQLRKIRHGETYREKRSKAVNLIQSILRHSKFGFANRQSNHVAGLWYGDAAIGRFWI